VPKLKGTDLSVTDIMRHAHKFKHV